MTAGSGGGTFPSVPGRMAFGFSMRTTFTQLVASGQKTARVPERGSTAVGTPRPSTAHFLQHGCQGAAQLLQLDLQRLEEFPRAPALAVSSHRLQFLGRLVGGLGK